MRSPAHCVFPFPSSASSRHLQTNKEQRYISCLLLKSIWRVLFWQWVLQSKYTLYYIFFGKNSLLAFGPLLALKSLLWPLLCNVILYTSVAYSPCFLSKRNNSDLFSLSLHILTLLKAATSLSRAFCLSQALWFTLFSVDGEKGEKKHNGENNSTFWFRTRIQTHGHF